MYSEWIEGQQRISFPQTWQIIKLDEHKYYKRISGLGVKAVDFLAIDPDWGLYLIELKDYPAPAHIPTPEAQDKMLAEKLNGSIKLIKTANAALRRQWYYRYIFIKLKIYRWCPIEWQIWQKAEQYLKEGRYAIIGDFASE